MEQNQINIDDVEKISWNVIDKLFKDNPQLHVKHHIDSYNRFYESSLKEIIRTKNPIHFYVEDLEKERKIEDTDKTLTHRYSMKMYIGGKNAEKIYYGKPLIADQNNNRQHYMYPNEARLKNMTYSFPIYYDVDVELTYIDDDDKINEIEHTVEKLYFGSFPLMLQSNLCLLKGLDSEVRYNLGECRDDKGGYFIIDGKEKAIVSQETRANNVLYVLEDRSDDFLFSSEIKSVSEDASKPVRTLSIKLVAPKPKSTNLQIVVNIPNVRKPVPLFILMRALGIESDKEIIQSCMLDLEKYEDIIEHFRPSVHDAGLIFTQEAAIKYIGSLTKRQTVSYALVILMDFLLPHMGETNFREKALYIGYMVKKLLLVYTKAEKPTDRDKYNYKRIEVTGHLLYQLFSEYYNLQIKHIFTTIDKKYYFHPSEYTNGKFLDLVLNKQNESFGNRITEEGFRKAFKGNWGAQAHTKRPGVVQDLNRLSFFSFVSQLRKTNLHISSDGAKVVAPRLLNTTQWGLLCPLHSPDGGNVGLHKHLSTSTHITSGKSMYPLVDYLLHPYMEINKLNECSMEFIKNATKVFVNGTWIGCTTKPLKLVQRVKLHRRNNKIDIYTSIYFNIKQNEIIIFCDAGRPCRPLFYNIDYIPNILRKNVYGKLLNGEISWNALIHGLNYKDGELNKIKWEDKYWEKNTNKLKQDSAVLEYVDSQEAEGILLATQENRLNIGNLSSNLLTFTHFEIHPSLILSFMANQIIFPENNPYPRNAFSCGQGKQGVSMYHTNFRSRTDKTTYLLNNGQTPLTKSRYYDYVTNSQHPYGINAIVAVMCYSGYNVEDAVLINKGSLLRGMFSTSYLNVYEAHEENSRNSRKSKTEKRIMSILDNEVVGMKNGYDYSLLDPKTGLIKEGSIVNDKTILIGKVVYEEGDEAYTDDSVSPKKGQIGVVDKSYITTDEEGVRVAKVRIRAARIPEIGDKFCSRAGQKGTIGVVIEEFDMPTSENGTRPDIIVNPHAMPSRMTIGHLVESQLSKTAAYYGGFGDCTAFVNNGPKHELFGRMLKNNGYHSSGCEILYNGMTGEQLKTEIYFGPTYYLRLKHMPKDKINYRARGPRNVLTRQTVGGRANDGGLRIGEMDRDCLIAHGMTRFISDSMMVRGDQYYMAICNQTGSVAIYNESKNIYLSPMVDGPIKFNRNIENEMNVNAESKNGRNFSIIRIPYAFKLLMQELLSMNVHMRIITDKNINNLTDLTSNSSAVKLSGLDTKQLLENIKINKMSKKERRLTEQIEKTIIPEMADKINTKEKVEEKDEEVFLSDEDFLNLIVNRNTGKLGEDGKPLDENYLIVKFKKPYLDYHQEEGTVLSGKFLVQGFTKGNSVQLVQSLDLFNKERSQTIKLNARKENNNNPRNEIILLTKDIVSEADSENKHPYFKLWDVIMFRDKEADGYLEGIFEIRMIDGNEFTVQNIDTGEVDFISDDMDIIKVNRKGEPLEEELDDDYDDVEPIKIGEDIDPEGIVSNIDDLDKKDSKTKIKIGEDKLEIKQEFEPLDTSEIDILSVKEEKKDDEDDEDKDSDDDGESNTQRKSINVNFD